MTFKNKRGDVPWYVVALLLALLVLAVSLGAVYKIRQNQAQVEGTGGNACENVGGGECKPACDEGETKLVGLCPAENKEPRVCCVSQG